MDHDTRADRRGRLGEVPARRPDVDGEAVRLFEEALAGIEAGVRPAWLPTWAFRKARGIRRRRSFARGWLGGHLGFVEDIAMREACARHGLAPEAEMPTVGRAVTSWRHGLDRHPEAG